MFKSEKISDYGVDYVLDYVFTKEEIETGNIWKNYYMERDYLNINYYNSLYADYEYYRHIIDNL